MQRSTSQDIRPSPLAGRWYPGEPGALVAMLDRFLNVAAARSVEGKLYGLLAPHAGLQYSGPVAAYAYALVRDMALDTVVIIGPMHHPMPGAVLTSAHSDYETPLGTVPVDHETLDVIGKTVRLNAVRDDPEHSVEIELPFLQHVLKPGFSLVPLMLRDQSERQAQALGSALADALKGRNALIVASSDLSHYYPQEVANQLDKQMLDCIETMDTARIVEVNEQGTAQACGYGAIATMLNTVRAWGVDHAQIVRYATSGNVTGDMDRVVGYGAAIFFSPS